MAITIHTLNVIVANVLMPMQAEINGYQVRFLVHSTNVYLLNEFDQHYNIVQVFFHCLNSFIFYCGRDERLSDTGFWLLTE